MAHDGVTRIGNIADVLYRIRYRAAVKIAAMRGSAAAKISPKIAAQIAAREARLADMAGKIRFPEDLPVSGRKEEIAAAISASPVVIVCGETGSGKQPSCPRSVWSWGGVHGLIGHTQPRRLAARSGRAACR